MTAAIFGLIGVAVGAVLQGATAWILERQRDHRATRGAARLTAGELMRATYRIYDALNDGTWATIRTEPIVLSRWQEHETTFAAVLQHEDWLTVYNAYLCVTKTNAEAQRNRPKAPIAPGADELDRFVHLIIRGATMLAGVGLYGPSQFSVRRIVSRIVGRLAPPSEDKMMAEVEARLDPRKEPGYAEAAAATENEPAERGDPAG